jgi:hypothetical protein
MDFLNKEKLTHIIIFIFILLSLTYLYNMNMGTQNINKTITENFMILSEDQDLGANNVMIDNLTQVYFKAGANDNLSINFADPNTTWPATLQQVIDSKLDNNGIVGVVESGSTNTPLQGIVLSDIAGKQLVKIGDSIPFGGPTTSTKITDNWIQFGGRNNGREWNSAQISAGGHIANSLNIVGMSSGTSYADRRVDMWVEGGCNMYGNLNVSSKVLLGDFGATMPRWPSAYTRINETGIQFGGANNGRQVDSAQITAGMHGENTLCIVGMATGTDHTTRKIAMWAEGGCNIYGPVYTAGTANIGDKVVLGDVSPVYPNIYTRINENGIQFGGRNNGREVNSAQITAGQHIGNSLNIVGMSNAAGADRKIDMWAEGGCNMYGSLAVSGSLSFLPIGCIIMWGRRNVAIPDGWRICDGNDGTPNLTGSRYPLGAGIESIGNTGGSASKTFTITEAQMPAHDHLNHPYLGANAGGNVYGGLHGGGNWHISSAQYSQSKGGNQPITLENMWLPYCAVVFIMRIR